MRAILLALPLLMFLIGGCVHSVKGAKMLITIKRAPTCQVVVTMDGSKVFVGKAAKPCPR